MRYDIRMAPVLDWIPRHDPRNAAYHVRLLAAGEPLKGRNRVWRRSIWLDQGSEGACTGFGLSHVLGTTPRRKINVTDEFARQRYYRARQEDQWDGEDYEGSSVLGAMEAARKDGMIKSYYWSTTLADIVYAVSYHGPLEIGVNWYSDMWDTDAAGFVHVSGDLVGGHALALAGVNIVDHYFWLYNSWGKAWGEGGAARISFDDTARLLSEDGEFALPKKPILPIWF